MLLFLEPPPPGRTMQGNKGLKFTPYIHTHILSLSLSLSYCVHCGNYLHTCNDLCDRNHKPPWKEKNKKTKTINVMADLEAKLKDVEMTAAAEEEEDLGADIMRSSTDEIINRIKLLENDIKVRGRVREREDP